MIKEILDYILSLLKSRLVPLALVIVVLFFAIITRLFSLQIINGESYRVGTDDSVKKTTSVTATRGNIYDKNGVLLAYNELAYAVLISDSGIYANNKTKNATLNKIIGDTITLIEEKGDTFYNNFQISVSDDGQYQYDVSGNSLLRFLRDTLGKSAISELSAEERAYSAKDVINVLCNRYELDINSYSPSYIVEILYLRTLMSANSYNRYMTFTIADEVSDETVAAILENSGNLIGVTVEEKYIRKYVDGLYCSQILGYTGAVSATELESLKEEDASYENNDTVGKIGIEKSMEKYLSGTKGSRTVYVDKVGRVTEVIEETEPVAGNDIYLTIDIELQKKLYYALEDKLTEILVKNLTEKSEKYEYYGSEIDHVYITQYEVYFAFIDNNMLALKKISESTSGVSKDIYNTFKKQFDSTKSWLLKELKTSPTPYSKLSSDNREYIWYIYKDILRANGIFLGANVDYNDSNYKQWISGGNLSMEEFLKYSISKNWIDMGALTDKQYVSLQESYESLVDYIMEQVEKDTDFHKKIYSVLINSGRISGRQLCIALYEQGVLEKDDYYTALMNGSMKSYDFIKTAISKQIITPAQLALKPCSGSCVMTDPTTGKVLALVSYPSYDNNMLSGSVDATYYSKLLNDGSKPLLNWATQSQMAPGSIYKICTSIAGMDLGIINSGTSIYCSGAFTEVTPSPKCWNTFGHGNETVATAIRDSCNVFFNTVGYRIAHMKTGKYDSNYGTDVLKGYAERLGLATLSGIEIEESVPHPSDELVIPTAIGQGTNKFSTINLARYMTTIATSGTCYNLTLIDKIVANDGIVVLNTEKAEVSNTVDVGDNIWDTVHYGMKLAGEGFFPSGKINGVVVAAKSGTAQEREDEPNHATMISYAPYDNPKVCTAVMIPNGYESAHARYMTVAAYEIYFEMYGK